MSQYQLSIQSELHLKCCRIARVLTTPQKQKYDTFAAERRKTPLALNPALVPNGQKPSGPTLHSCVT